MDTVSQTSFLVAVTSFALGFSVLARNVRNILFLTFAMLTSLVSAWAFAFFLSKIWTEFGFYRLHLLFNILLGPAALLFIRVMVRVHDKLSRRLFGLSLFLSSILILALLFQFESHSWVLQMIYFSPALVFVQILHLMWVDRKMRRGFQRFPKVPTVGLGRRNLIYGGGLLVLGTSVMDHVSWMGPVLPSIGNLALTAYIFFLSQAITQQRLLNMSALFSRFLVLLVVALSLTAVYSLMLVWTDNSPGLFFLNSFIASFLLLTLLEPIRSVVGYLTQRLLTQKYQKLQQTILDAQRRLTGIVDLGTLAQAVLETANQTLHPQWGALFVLRGDGAVYQRVRVIERELKLSPQSGVGTSCREILAHHPMLNYCETLARKGKFPVILDQILENEIDRSASRAQREQYARLIEGVKALGSNLLIPMISSEKILGFVVLQVPTPPEPWGNNWGLLPLIYPYFEQAAQTMENMEVFARQKEKERLATLGEMAAGLAHEIRNPLGAIKGAAQFLDPSSDRPESRFLKVIVDEVDRLNRVVTQFLDYSKPPAVELKPVDLSKLAEKTIELMRPSLKASLEIVFQSSPEPARVLASGEQMHQILINLIQNAQRAVEDRSEGRIRVSVSVERGAQNSHVVLTVEDNGKGIRKDHLEKIFIPFFTTSPSGTGLGLSISQKIVEAHRGRIEVLSEEKRFTKVSVILPYLKE